MGFGALRSLIRPIVSSRASIISPRTFLQPHKFTSSPNPDHPTFTSLFRSLNLLRHHLQPSPWLLASSNCSLHTLTDTRFPKRRPGLKSRRKRASLKPPGPYAWVKYTPGEPILPNNPNEGSVKRRNAKKRIGQRRAFILAEKKKRKAQLQEAKRKKNIRNVERKMAAVARDREWAQRLAELQQIEEEKKRSMV